MNERRIATFSRENVPPGDTDWARLRAMSDDEIEAGAAGDADNPPATPAVMAQAAVVHPEDRGRISVSLHLDADVLEFFQAAGPDYQAGINRALREHMERRRPPRRAAG